MLANLREGSLSMVSYSFPGIGGKFSPETSEREGL
jgi:hypothetical protein